jgi:hypothetical protein
MLKPWGSLIWSSGSEAGACGIQTAATAADTVAKNTLYIRRSIADSGSSWF